ncbi:MAG TPA: hypothetical protein V6C89_01155 [Drouetiella sp.]
MFHKYDFGTASQISSRRWTATQLEPETPKPGLIAAVVVFIEICAIAALLLVPHFFQKAHVASHAHKQIDHRISEHLHHATHHVV